MERTLAQSSYDGAGAAEEVLRVEENARHERSLVERGRRC